MRLRELRNLSPPGEYEGNFGPGNPVVYVDVRGKFREPLTLTREHMRLIGTLTRTRKLTLENCRMDSAGVAELGTLKELRELDLSRSDLTDGSLSGLPSLEWLERLNLGWMRVGDGGVSGLVRFPRL